MELKSETQAAIFKTKHPDMIHSEDRLISYLNTGGLQHLSP